MHKYAYPAASVQVEHEQPMLTGFVIVMDDPRVTLRADVEPYRLSGRGGAMFTTTGADISVSYDLGHAREALKDLDFAYGRVQRKLNEAIMGEKR